MLAYIEKGIKIDKEDYVRFYMYLDRCKGFEKDTLRFIFATNDTEHIQMDWAFVKPLFARAVNFKSGNDILELFEQIKNKLMLNKANSKLPKEQQTVILENIKTEFYK